MDNGGLACPVLDVRAPDDGYIDVEALAGGATSVDDSADEPDPPASADIRAEGVKGACGCTANFEIRSKEGRRGAPKRLEISCNATRCQSTIDRVTPELVAPNWPSTPRTLPRGIAAQHLFFPTQQR